MTINGISGVNTQTGQIGMNQAMDSYSKNIQDQIVNAQKQLQELSSNERMTPEEKMKKRQEIQQQISDLNMQLRQHQIEQRREERREQQAKGSSMDETLGGTNAKTGSKSTGLSQAGMTAMISADASLKQAKMQGGVASGFGGRAGVLEIEIKLDESRAVNGLTANTEGKKAELAEMEQKAMDVTEAQAKTLGDVNEALEEAAKADERAEGKDTEAPDVREEKAKEKVSEKEQPHSVPADRDKRDQDTALAGSEPLSDAEVSEEQLTAAYAHVDVKL